VLVAALIRWRLLEVPLDRDEGEYAYFGQLLLAGVPPYAAAYNLKLPGIYGAYALILGALGQTTAAIRIGLMVVTSLTTVGLYALGSRLAGPVVGILAAALFAAESLNPKLLGIAAYAEHFALLPVVGGALVLLNTARDRRLAPLSVAGLLFGLGFLVRQSAILFIVAGFVYLLTTHVEEAARAGRTRAATVFLAGAVTPLALTCLALTAAGTFRTFWFWTVQYAPYYQADLLTGWSNLIRTLSAVAPSSSVVLTLALIGSVAIGRDRLREGRLLVLFFAAASLLGAAVGLQFRPHYFLLTVPAVAVLAAVGLSALSGLVSRPSSTALRRGLPIAVALAAIAQPLYASRAILFELSPAEVSRAIYGRNPFPESVEVARYIREHSEAGDRVAVVGSEPQIYFYSSRRSATGFIYTYPLMERQPYAAAMQQQMIREVESAGPRFLVFVSATRSWVVKPDSDRTIFRWFEEYQRGFRRIGVVDIVSQQETIYRWADAALDYKPRSDVWLMVFERAGPR
jgi:hypothetical protein